MMNKKRVILINIAVIAAMLAVVLGIVMLSGVLPEKEIQPNAGVLEPENKPDGEETETATQPLAYLVVTVAEEIYEPIALTEPGRYRISRGDYVNVIEVTENSVWMAESTCDNQDCIYQGTVTLENKSERVLQNMILCLPNEVILELYTYEELLAAYPGWQGGQAQ